MSPHLTHHPPVARTGTGPAQRRTTDRPCTRETTGCGPGNAAEPSPRGAAEHDPANTAEHDPGNADKHDPGAADQPYRRNAAGRGSGNAAEHPQAHDERRSQAHGRRHSQARGGSGPDAGVATVWAAGAIAVLVVLLTAALAIGGAVAARHRASSAADLAALAAAGHAVSGEAESCERAAAIARQQGALLSGCRLDGWEALVEVEVPRLVHLPAFGGPAHARARAGPWVPIR